MKISTKSLLNSIISTILVFVSFTFISLGIFSSVNVDAAPAKKITTKKLITKKVVQKIRYVESLYACFKPNDRSYNIIKKYIAFDNIDKCNDYAKSEKAKLNPQVEEAKPVPEAIKAQNPTSSSSSTNNNTDYSNFITKISSSDNSSSTSSSVNNNSTSNTPSTSTSTPSTNQSTSTLRYLNPVDVGNVNCTTTSTPYVNKIYNCQFEANTNGTSIDNPATSETEYLKLAVRTFNGSQDLANSEPCYLSNGKMYCSNMNISGLSPDDYYLYFVGNHEIQWKNFGMFSVSTVGDLSTTIRELPSCGGMVNFSCDVRLNVFLFNNSPSNLDNQVIRVNFPPCVDFKSNGSSTNAVYHVFGNTVDIIIPRYSAYSNQGYLLLFTPNSNNISSCQYTTNGNYFTTQFTATPLMPKYYLDTNTSNNASVITVYISKSVG